MSRVQQPDQSERRLHPACELLTSRTSATVGCQTERDVLLDGEMRKERVALEDDVERPPLGRQPVISRPSSRTRPRSTVSRPARMRRSVVLPQPLGPSRLKKVPPGIVRSTSSRATTSPKRFVTPSTRTCPRRPSAAAHSPGPPVDRPARPARRNSGTAIASASHGTAIRSVATALIEGSIER